MLFFSIDLEFPKVTKEKKNQFEFTHKHDINRDFQIDFQVFKKYLWIMVLMKRLVKNSLYFDNSWGYS